MSAKYDYRGSRPMRLLRALVEAFGTVAREAEEEIRSYDLSTGEFDCLVTLGVSQPMRMCDLARQCLLTKSHTTQVMKQLEARGLVRRRRSPESDREVLASLTAEGQELFERVYPRHYEFLRAWWDARLTAEEQEQLAGLLRRIADGPEDTHHPLR